MNEQYDIICFDEVELNYPSDVCNNYPAIIVHMNLRMQGFDSTNANL